MPHTIAQAIHFIQSSYLNKDLVRPITPDEISTYHQDEPYWSVEGYDTCIIWMPLVPVNRENALAYVPGSHRADSIYYQYNFSDLNPDGKTGVEQVVFSAIAQSELPDIDAGPERYGVVNWDMQPGDCVAFNSRIMHGGSGKLEADRELRVFTI